MMLHRALSLLVALLAAAPTIATQSTVRIAIPNTVTVGVGAEIVVTGRPATPMTITSTCMTHQGFRVESPGVYLVLINPNRAPKAQIVQGAFANEFIRPGTRLRNLVNAALCFEGGVTYLVFSGDVTSPTQRGVAFVVAPSGVTLTSDHEAVVSASDASGDSDTVCVKKGSAAIRTKLRSDIPLPKGSRLVGFIFVDYDATTGKTCYAALVDY